MSRRAVIVPDLSDGHCRDLGDAFFPDEGYGRLGEVRVALRVCDGCPVIDPCRAYAVAAGERHGIWGGRDMERHTRRPRSTRPGPRAAAAANPHRRTTMTTTEPTTSPSESEIWTVAARTHQLIAQIEYNFPEVESDEILLAFLRELSTRRDLELLSTVFGQIDEAKRQATAERAEHAASVKRREAALTAAINIDCPKCNQPAGSPCRGPRKFLLSAPHESRVTAAAADGQ